MEFKKFNYINASKKFCKHFHYINLYYRHIQYGISQKQHIFRVYIIHSNCVRLRNFFFLWWTKGGIGIKMSWVEKNRKINNPGEGKIIRDSRVHHFNASKTPYRDRIDLMQTLKGRCMVKYCWLKSKFLCMFFDT